MSISFLVYRKGWILSMAYEVENGCVGCPSEMGCLGDTCPNKRVTYFYCDCCGESFEPEDLYIFEGEHEDKELCEECLAEAVKTKAKTVKNLLDDGKYFI